jgi:hypothetical protein
MCVAPTAAGSNTCSRSLPSTRSDARYARLVSWRGVASSSFRGGMGDQAMMRMCFENRLIVRTLKGGGHGDEAELLRLQDRGAEDR